MNELEPRGPPIGSPPPNLLLTDPSALGSLETLLRELRGASEARASESIEVRAGSARATIWIRAGELVDAETDWKRGVPAFLEVIRWPVSGWSTSPGCDREGDSLQLTDLLDGVRTSHPPLVSLEPVGSLQELLDRIAREIPELVAIELVELGSGLSIAGASSELGDDAAASFGEVLKASLSAIELMGAGARDELDDVLLNAARGSVLLKSMGPDHYLVIALAKRANAGLARAIAKKYSPAARRAIARLAEIP